MLVREIRDAAGLSQAQLAERASTTQSLVAGLEDAECTSLKTIEKIATGCGATLKVHAQEKRKLELEVSLVS